MQDGACTTLGVKEQYVYRKETWLLRAKAPSPPRRSMQIIGAKTPATLRGSSSCGQIDHRLACLAGLVG